MDRSLERIASVGAFVGASAATMAGLTIWLLLTNPTGVASALVDRSTLELLWQLASVTYEVILTVLQYL